MTSSLLFNTTTFAYLISMLLFFVFLASRNKAVGLAAMAIAYGGLLSHSIAIALRWKESYDMGVGHAPLSNLYESVVFFSWTIVLIYALLDIKGTFSKLTMASLLSDRGFMPSTMNPRWANSRVPIMFMKLDVRWIVRNATLDTGPESGT